MIVSATVLPTQRPKPPANPDVVKGALGVRLKRLTSVDGYRRRVKEVARLAGVRVIEFLIDSKLKDLVLDGPLTADDLPPVAEVDVANEPRLALGHLVLDDQPGALQVLIPARYGSWAGKWGLTPEETLGNWRRHTPRRTTPARCCGH